MKKILFSICILLFGACEDKNDEVLKSEPSTNIKAIVDNGIIIDSVALNYATIYKGNDDFPIIKPNPINQFVDKNEILIYFELISNSRDSLVQYYSKKDEEDIKKGIIVEHVLKYDDTLESISIEVKKNDNEFYKINNDSNVIKLIPTPEINSEHTFAKYEMTIGEFLTRYKASFPEYFVLSYDNKELESSTYIFKTTFKFNNDKQFVLNTNPISF